MKPKIAVLPLLDKNNDNLWINHMYFDGLIKAGAIPYLLPLTDDPEDLELFCHQFDGFLFTGGQDVEPSLYGEEKLPQCGYQAPRRDAQELWMLRRLLELDKPVLGICRGVQMMDVALGGTMYQDLPSQFGTQVDHSQIEKLPFTQPSHWVEVVPGTKVAQATGGGRIMVNSMHHQAVKDVADCFTVSALADDGLVEALEHKTARYMVGVQWHPEFLWPEYDHAMGIFRQLVRAAEGEI